MTKAQSIPFVAWRDGRPRFVPSENLRKAGHKGHDLRHEDRRWFTRGEALDWSDKFQEKLDLDRQADAARKAEDDRKALRARQRVRAATTPAEKPVPAPRPATTETGPKSYPVCQLWHDWLNSPRKRKGKKRISPRTIDNYLKHGKVLENHAPDIWTSEVLALDKPICNGLYEDIWEKHGHATANNVLTALGAAISWGMLSGKVRGLPENPAHKLGKVTVPPRCRFGTKEEVEALVEAADGLHLFNIGDSITLGVWQGQRQGDRLTMRSPSMLGNITPIQQNKTGAIVAIPTAPILKKRMKASLERRRKADKVSDYVILDEETWKPFKDDEYRKIFALVRKVAAHKVPSVATLQDKDLRATCVTWSALAGSTIPQIASITGHTMTSVHEILKHYLALHPDMAASAIGKLVDWYESGASAELAI